MDDIKSGWTFGKKHQRFHHKRPLMSPEQNLPTTVGPSFVKYCKESHRFWTFLFKTTNNLQRHELYDKRRVLTVLLIPWKQRAKVMLFFQWNEPCIEKKRTYRAETINRISRLLKSFDKNNVCRLCLTRIVISVALAVSASDASLKICVRPRLQRI